MLRPLTRICPEVGGSSRKRSRRKVDLPAPDGPVKNTNSPRSMVQVTSASACRKRPYSLDTRKSWIMGGCQLSVISYQLSVISFSESARQGFSHPSRIGARRRALHHLPDEPTERPRPAGPVEVGL